MCFDLYFSISKGAAEVLAITAMTAIVVYVIKDIADSYATDDEPAPDMD